MSKTEAAVTTEAPVAAPKAPSKMDKAKELYTELQTATLAEGDSIRKQFIARAQTEIGLTKSGAITYYNNLRGVDNGKKLYQYTKKTTKAESSGEQSAPEATGEQDTAEQSEEAQS